MKKRYFIAFIITILLLCITHHIWLGYKESMNFDCLLFIIILVLGYLLSLKLTSYIADFKTLQNQSRIEIIFLSVFFVLLFLPVSHINQSKISKFENRNLAKSPHLITKNENLNLKFGKEFEHWFNDRFFLRRELINLNTIYKLLSYKHFETNKTFYYKEYNVVFSKTHIPEKDTVPKKMLPKIVHSMDQFNLFCKKHNIKLYVLIVPYNQYIYQNYAKDYANPEGLAQLNKNIKELQKLSKTDIIYVYDDLKKASQTQKEAVAFKVDHHWTEYGAFIGYNRLIKEINKDYPDISPVKKDNYKTFRSKKVRCDFDRTFTNGNTLQMAPGLNLYANKILDTEYLYYENKDKQLLKTKVTETDDLLTKTYYYPKGANYRVLEIGTSMNENLLQFTPYTFKNLKYISLNNIKNRKDSEIFKIMKYYKKDILNYKPDIIIFCITPINLTRIPQIFEKK